MPNKQTIAQVRLYNMGVAIVGRAGSDVSISLHQNKHIGMSPRQLFVSRCYHTRRKFTAAIVSRYYNTMHRCLSQEKILLIALFRIYSCLPVMCSARFIPIQNENQLKQACHIAPAAYILPLRLTLASQRLYPTKVPLYKATEAE